MITRVSAAHLTAGGFSSRARSTGLGAQSHLSPCTPTIKIEIHTIRMVIHSQPFFWTDWFVYISAAWLWTQTLFICWIWIPCNKNLPSLQRLVINPSPVSSGCPSYCCRMWTIDGHRGPEVTLSPPTDESHICKCVYTVFMSLCCYSPKAVGLIYFILQTVSLSCAQTPDLSL